MNPRTNQFDFTRNDKFYALTIPKYILQDDTVLYEFHLRDLISNREYIHTFRFKELKEINESLNVLKLELPEFPKTHFWKKTNKNPQMIEQRRIRLESFFHIVTNDPFTRGFPQIKKLIHKIKHSSYNTQRFSSLGKPVKSSSSTRSHSLPKMCRKELVDIDELRKQADGKSNKAKSFKSKK